MRLGFENIQNLVTKYFNNSNVGENERESLKS